MVLNHKQGVPKPFVRDNESKRWGVWGRGIEAFIEKANRKALIKQNLALLL